MDTQHTKKRTGAKTNVLGGLYLILFALLIISGIVVKRVFGHPEFMTFFHLPAAVFLVLGGYQLTEKSRAKYKANLEKWRERKAS